jgi:phosphoribosylanthranilate isomerase
MRATRHPRIKICCIASLEEAALAVRYGAAALGLVSAMPSGPGVISEELIAAIAARVPPGIASFLLTSLQSPAAIMAQQRRCGTNTIQICDRLATSAYGVLRRELPGIGLVQVIHVMGPEAVAEASEVAPLVDALLLDSGNQSLPVKQLGGTGRIHDWTLSRAIRETVDAPIYLAGGLRPENVAAAIQQVAPFGLDVCTGLRTDGRLDEAKLARFMAVIQRAAGTEDGG